jgi:hypothetical protein
MCINTYSPVERICVEYLSYILSASSMVRLCEHQMQNHQRSRQVYDRQIQYSARHVLSHVKGMVLFHPYSTTGPMLSISHRLEMHNASNEVKQAWLIDKA